MNDTLAVYILMLLYVATSSPKYLLFIQVQEHELKTSGKQPRSEYALLHSSLQFDRSCSRVMDMDYGLT